MRLECDLHNSIPDWIIEYPETSEIFAELQLDVSCGGKSLEYVATHQGLDPQAVLRELQQRCRERSSPERNQAPPTSD